MGVYDLKNYEVTHHDIKGLVPGPIGNVDEPIPERYAGIKDFEESEGKKDYSTPFADNPNEGF